MGPGFRLSEPCKISSAAPLLQSQQSQRYRRERRRRLTSTQSCFVLGITHPSSMNFKIGIDRCKPLDLPPIIFSVLGPLGGHNAKPGDLDMSVAAE